MRNFLSILCLVLAMLCAAHWWPIRHDSPARPPAIARDSVDRARAVEVVRWDTLVRVVYRASADTLAAILRERARRLPLRLLPTLDSLPRIDSAAPPCLVTLTCQDSRRLVLRDSAQVMRADSLEGAIVVQRAVLDSVVAVCQPRSPWMATGIGFGVGYLAGIGTCLALR